MNPQPAPVGRAGKKFMEVGLHDDAPPAGRLSTSLAAARGRKRGALPPARIGSQLEIVGFGQLYAGPSCRSSGCCL